MTGKLVVVGALGILLFVGVLIFTESFTHSVEIQHDSVAEPEREEAILRAFFNDELARKAIAHLAQYDLESFEAVAQPRPRLSNIVQRFGEPDAVVEEDLSPFGVAQRGRVYRYGRLGLVYPAQQSVDEVFWIHIAAR